MDTQQIKNIATDLQFNRLTENEAKDMLLKICGLNGICCDNMVLTANLRDGGQYCENCEKDW